MAPPVSRFALRGRVVTMDANRRVIADGVVYVDAGAIVDVKGATAQPPPGFEAVTPLATKGTIYPGLIELHNHLPYNALPLFRIPKLYANRDRWRGTKGTQRYISGPAGVLARASGAIQATVRYAECKCLVGGVTTSQGITLRSESIRRYFRGVVRNAELPDDDRLPPARPKVGDVDEGGAVAFNKTLKGDGARLIHLSEGTDDVARGYFLRLQLPDGTWAINGRLAGIHSTALRPADLTVLAAHGGHIVWSPFSNLALYGKTTDIARARAKHITVALGSDWAPTGSKNLLGELKVARLYADLKGIALDDEALVEMVTVNPASILGWSERLGSIEPGRLADLVVIAGKSGAPYTHLVESTESGVALVVIRGRACYGRADLVGPLAPVTDTAAVAGEPRAFSLEADPVVGDVRLSAATDVLVDTLGNLVDLADGLATFDLGVAAAGPVEGATGDERWFLDLDLDLPDPFAGASLAGSSYADIAVNLKLDPLATEGDDAFFAQLANLANLPPAVRDGLPGFYGETPHASTPIGAEHVDDADEIATVDAAPILELSELTSMAPRLRAADRRVIVDQAIVILNDLYVHLPLKRSMHAVDPVQRLRLLRHRLTETPGGTPEPDIAFHNELTAVFTSLRDLHTHYVLPEPFRSLYAYLPFLVELCAGKDGPRYLVTKLARGFNQPPFGPGVEVTHWNGVPLERAVRVLADQQSGSNMDARIARGMDALVIRALGRMRAPDEEWVTVTYRAPGGEVRELRQRWLIQQPEEPPPFDDEAGGANIGTLGIDAQTEAVNRARRDLYSRAVARARRAAAAVTVTAPPLPPDEVETSMPTVFRARSRRTRDGDVAHIRIFTFLVSDCSAFVKEFVRLVEALPQRGLILDVRGNGGGDINAAERLLQVLTPGPIEPQQAQFITSALVQRLCEANAPSKDIPSLDLGAWIPSIVQAVETGATYSLGFSITDADDANDFGQRYHGPVVLVTDARCYSATDIFAAGFRDHDIGPILGTAGNTGAGGANVWTHGLLRRLIGRRAGGALKELPDGASFRVAIRRTTRVGRNAGAVLEDLGVVPDQVHALTERDVMSDNEDLIIAAAGLLKTRKPRALQATITRDRGGAQVTVTAENVDRVDAFVAKRPVGSFDVKDDTCTFRLEPRPPKGARLDLTGYEAGQLVAARRHLL